MVNVPGRRTCGKGDDPSDGEMSESPETPGFLAIGNRLWLDLVNTEMVVDGSRVDLLGPYADVVRWARLTSAFTADEADAADARWAFEPDGARAADAVRAFRGVLRAMAERMADGGDAAADEV